MTLPAIERRAFELRTSQDGQVVEGVAMPYGQTGQVGDFTEEFRAGAFALHPGGVFLNVQHDRGRVLAKHPGGGLTVTESEAGLSIRAELPDTTEGRDARTLIERGVLAGLSIEFRAIRDTWEGAHRIISEAVLSAVAIVDRPAYPGATVTAEGRSLETEAWFREVRQIERSMKRRLRQWRSL